MKKPEASPVPDALIEEVGGLRAALVELADKAIGSAEAIHPHYRDSARNLVHYLAMRQHDLRPLQARLAELGLSSLGRSEPHVLASVDAVLGVLHRLVGREAPAPAGPAPFGFEAGTQLLNGHTEALLGETPVGRNVRIMVTMPGEAAFDYQLVHDLLAGGMNCMRINCAHDEPGAWLRMIEHLRRAEQALKRRCKVLMDLAGPKLRTGPVAPGPKVKKVRPQRDAFGRVTAPARLWLHASEAAEPPSEADASLPVAEGWLRHLAEGDRVVFEDAGGRTRQLEIVEIGPGYAWGLCANTAYLAPGTMLRREGGHGKHRETRVGELPAQEGCLLLHQGDLLLLTPDDEPGEAATHDRAGRLLTPAHIGCTLPQVFADVRAGDSVWLDDGRIGGMVEKVNRAGLHVRIARARPRGERLRADKGINLPDSPLQLPALTEQDRDDLRFIVEHADMVAMSFANSVEDVEALTAEIARLGRGTPAIVLKIETRRGFDHLPSMLLAAMRSAACGVMIARGDLAVECGYERLAEVQEEMLWICEAAHVPVIWATQVLETLAKEGIPSRAEITDAAMGHRAECVMLNKGPHILRAVQTLDDILHRMRRHQDKKRPMLRQLHLASAFHGGRFAMTAASAAIRSDVRVIGLVGFAHGTSHFFHLLLPPLFPWLMPEFGLSFTQAGAMMTVFFVVSALGQAASGFVVDRIGPRRVLLAGIACFVLAALVLAAANGYAMLLAVGALAGLGNSVFHPADFTVLNRKVSPARLGHALSVHGLSGNIGWAIAPVFLTGIAAAAGWRAAALGAAALGALAWAVVWLRRDATELAGDGAKVSHGGTASTFGFLGAGAVWMCFAFFLLITTAFGALQNFATPLMQNVYGLSVAAAAATLTAFLLGGAAGIVAGGVLAGRSGAHDRLIAAALGAAALMAVVIAAGVLPAWSVSLAMGVMGFCAGIAGPSRDLLVRHAATARFGQQAYGRVYGFVYSGLDLGLAVSPLLFGPLMDAGRFGAVLVGVALLQGAAILTALGVGRLPAR